MPAADAKPEMKSEMKFAGKYEFKVVNLTTAPLPENAKVRWVSWQAGVDDSEELDVSNLAVHAISVAREIRPAAYHADYWSYLVGGVIKGTDHVCNVYVDDRYIVVTISQYGLSVIKTRTSPCSFAW